MVYTLTKKAELRKKGARLEPPRHWLDPSLLGWIYGCVIFLVIFRIYTVVHCSIYLLQGFAVHTSP